jgi:radical SAM superfamily enzyme YgiQ (UPF0313 family)
MKVKIIAPNSDEVSPSIRSEAELMPNVALTYLAALAPEGIDFKLVDMALGDPADYDDPCDLAGITVKTALADAAYSVADEFIKKGIPVALGGPHITAFPHEASQHATTVVIGEAENTWKVLLQDLGCGQLKRYYVGGPFDTSGLQGSVHHDPEYPDLTGLPHLRRDLLPRKRYTLDSIFTTRGCPFGCSFCPVKFLNGTKVRHRPIGEVVAEVNELRSMYFNLDDSAFPAYDQLYYLDLYRELSGLRPKRRWMAFGSLNAINQPNGREVLKNAADSGLIVLMVGVESVDKGGLEQSGAWRKLGAANAESYSLEKTRQAIRTIQDNGIAVNGHFVIGFDNDTPDTFVRTLEFCDEMSIMPSIYILTPVPGSAQYMDFEKAGRIPPRMRWAVFDSLHLLFQHPTLGIDEAEASVSKVMREGYSMGRIIRRIWHLFKKHPDPYSAIVYLFMQLGTRKDTRTAPHPE